MDRQLEGGVFLKTVVTSDSFRFLPGDAWHGFCINTSRAGHAHPFLCPFLEHYAGMESYDAMSLLVVIALSFLLVPVVIGWMFLALRIAMWVLQVFVRADDDEAPSVEPMTCAGKIEDSACNPVSPVVTVVCTAGKFSTAACDEDDATDVINDMEVWDNVMKNSLWEEFYGGMGEEEYENVRNYSPR